MSERLLTVSFGTTSLAAITSVRQVSWADFAKWLTQTPPETDDKAARGWYCPVEFSPVYRDSDNFVARHALTFDFDHVGTDAWQRVLDAWGGLAFTIYTTASHTPEKPRFRVVMPLSRPATYDEFQAVVRKVATDVDIELLARESFTPAQCMFAPTRQPGGEFNAHVNEGDWLDVDSVLGEYRDWTDHTQWPHRVDHDGVHKSESLTSPLDKVGLVGDFCRAFRIPEAIARFELPYKPGSTEGRYTYTDGSRPDGMRLYDDETKAHSEHDTDPARGQSNSFDLVRLHRFHRLDTEADKALPISERPSYRAMCQLALDQPELRNATAAADFAAIGDLGPLTEPEKIEHGASQGRDRFAVQEAGEFSGGPPMRWIVKQVLPRAEVAVLFGASGVGKSFLALDLSAAITRGVKWQNKTAEKGRVVYVAAEGAGGFRQRLQAYAYNHSIDICELPSVIADAPNMLDLRDVEAVAKAIVKWAKSKKEEACMNEPLVDIIVLDTMSAVTPGANENSGEDIGKLLEHCKLLHRMTGALVLLVHHAGKDESKGARGWSGLRAAADVEIAVTRGVQCHTMRITKMKDGDDSAQYYFRLKTVHLGVDPEGDPLTSCVIEFVQPPALPKGKRTPTGAQKVALETVEKMSLQGESIAIADAIEAIVLKTPKPSGRDIRHRKVERNIASLIENGWLFLDGEDRVSRQPLQPTETGAFDV